MSNNKPPNPAETTDSLHYANVLDTLSGSLNLSPRSETTETASQPSSGVLRNRADLLVATLNAAMLALGFRLVGLGEDGNLPSGSSGDQLPTGWNNGDSYAFRYKHPQSSLTFLLKSVRMGDRVVVHGMGVEDGKLRSTELRFDTYLRSSSFPLPSSFAPGEPGSDHPLLSYFTSAQSLQDLLNLFKIDVVQRIMPGLQKEGYQETVTEPPAAAGPSNPIRPAPVPHPLGGIPDYSGPRRPQGGYGGYPQMPGYGGGLGSRDLDPFAGGYPGPGGLRLPGSGYGGGFGGPGGFGGGGSIMGMDDPIFGGGGRVPYPGAGGGYPGQGPLAGPGGQRLPPGAVPPGARFDPIVPSVPGAGGVGPRPGPSGGFPGPGRSLGGPAQPRTFPGEPDNDLEPPPPGYDDMFM